jgi:hypothetical protein
MIVAPGPLGLFMTEESEPFHHQPRRRHYFLRHEDVDVPEWP